MTWRGKRCGARGLRWHLRWMAFAALLGLAPVAGGVVPAPNGDIQLTDAKGTVVQTLKAKDLMKL